MANANNMNTHSINLSDESINKEDDIQNKGKIGRKICFWKKRFRKFLNFSKFFFKEYF